MDHKSSYNAAGEKNLFRSALSSVLKLSLLLRLLYYHAHSRLAMQHHLFVILFAIVKNAVLIVAFL